MKSTKFVEPFAKVVDFWERTLSYIMETLDVALQVQRQWLYLEVIPYHKTKFQKLNNFFTEHFFGWRHPKTTAQRIGSLWSADWGLEKHLHQTVLCQNSPESHALQTASVFAKQTEQNERPVGLDATSPRKVTEQLIRNCN